MDKGIILEGVRGLLGNIPNDFNILEEEIDIGLQFEYFKQAKKYRAEQRKALKTSEESEEQQPKIDLESLLEELHNETSDIKEKKSVLIKIAGINEVEAFRALENYREEAPQELAQWIILACQESKMKLESSLLDENQVFISTGMGGRGNKLRYSVAFTTEDKEPLTEVQQGVVSKEVEFALNAEDCELEQIRFEEEFAIFKALVPMDKDIEALFKQTIVDCNQLGKFLNDNFVVTNVKDFTIDRLRKYQNTESAPEGDDEVVIGNSRYKLPTDIKDLIEEAFSDKLEGLNGHDEDLDIEWPDNEESQEEPED